MNRINYMNRINHILYIKAFAWLALIGLSFSLFSEFWLPMLVGAVLVSLMTRIALPHR